MKPTHDVITRPCTLKQILDRVHLGLQGQTQIQFLSIIQLDPENQITSRFYSEFDLFDLKATLLLDKQSYFPAQTDVLTLSLHGEAVNFKRFIASYS